MMTVRLLALRRIFIYIGCVHFVQGYVMINVTSDTNKCPGYTTNISCIVNPQQTAVLIVMPNTSYAATCTAPLNGTDTNCTQVGPYKTAVTKSEKATTFVLTIPSLIKSIHHGNWTCQHGNESNTKILSVITPLISKGRVPGITTNVPLDNIVSYVNISGYLYCQNSGITPELLYASEGDIFHVLETNSTQWSYSNLESSNCNSGETNQLFTIKVSWEMPTLRGKKVTFKIRFYQNECNGTYTTNSSLAFIFTDTPKDSFALIKHNGSSLSVADGIRVNLQCEVRGGIPLAEITWSCFGGNITNTSVNGIARSNITFRTTKDQNGHFCTCVATHPVAEIVNRSVKIIVTYAAYITSMDISGENFTVREHSTPTITCNVEGSPLPLIKLKYIRNNTVIAKTTGLGLQYKFPYARCEDTGKYRCEANNSFQLHSHVIKEVYVLCYPRLINTAYQKRQLSVGLGESLRISTMYLAFPKPEFNWFFQLTKLSNKSKLTNDLEDVEISQIEYDSEIFRHGSHFVKKSLKEEDFGIYSITATNDVNVSIYDYNVEVKVKPNQPSNVAVECLNHQSAHVTWVSELENGDSQIFIVHYQSSTEDKFSEAINDPGLKERATTKINGLKESSLYFFTIIARNKFGDTKSLSVNCTTHGNPNLIERSIIGVAAGAVVGSLAFILLVVIILIYLLRRRKRNSAKANETKSKIKSSLNSRRNDDNDEDEMIINELYVSAGPNLVKSGSPRGNVGGVKESRIKKIGSSNLETIFAQNQEKSETADNSIVDNQKKREITYKNIEMANCKSNDKEMTTDEKETKKFTNLSKSKDLIYIDVDIQEPINSGTVPIIHGEKDQTNYIEIDFTKAANQLPRNSGNKGKRN